MGRSLSEADRFLGLEPSPSPGPALRRSYWLFTVLCPSLSSLPSALAGLAAKAVGGAPGALKPPWAGASDQPEWPAVWEGRRASLAGRGLRALLLSA